MKSGDQTEFRFAIQVLWEEESGVFQGQGFPVTREGKVLTIKEVFFLMLLKSKYMTNSSHLDNNLFFFLM